jgi:hypothetical protein
MNLIAALFISLALFFAPIEKIEVTTPAAGQTTTDHQVVLTWTLPNTCTDGSPCTPVAITVYKIVGTCSAPTTQFTKIASLAGNVKTYTDPNLAPATTYCYYVTASLATPAAWSATTTYTGGQTVTYNSAVYVALNNANANLNQIPSSSPNFWGVSTVESAASNTAGGSTGTTGPPNPPSGLTATVQ